MATYTDLKNKSLSDFLKVSIKQQSDIMTVLYSRFLQCSIAWLEALPAPCDR